ncbi:hypothetical protein BDV28DRAFT_42388 [Aspergillus coremiiformis]|uniref:Uncharacterized protein n=1 Tax=Aspergillus coremiiformis TaxID=138285 RepID=A0A5N6ZE09_9EURO|nr:hypothetical protein BDV28DRAFT_42388 [Aspergillus coremiiformis]
MTSNYNTRKFSNRVRPKDDDESSTQQPNQQSGMSDWDPTKQFTMPSHTASGSSQAQPADSTAPSTQTYTSKYHFTHDELSHPDE